MQLEAVIALFPSLDTVELTGWIERRWVVPTEVDEGGFVFAEIDVARVRLIYDLRRDLAVGEDAVPVVLALLDQVYELRGRMKAIIAAIDRQPATVRDAILAAIE